MSLISLDQPFSAATASTPRGFPLVSTFPVWFPSQNLFPEPSSELFFTIPFHSKMCSASLLMAKQSLHLSLSSSFAFMASVHILQRSQARSLAQLQELMHCDLGQ